MAWEFLQAHFDEIWGMIEKASPSLMGAVVSFCANGFASEARHSIRKLSRFSLSLHQSEASIALGACLEPIRGRHV